MEEAVIVINGRRLTEAQAMTVRIALGSLMVDMKFAGLGDDEHGRLMAEAYLLRASEVDQLLKTPASQQFPPTPWRQFAQPAVKNRFI